MTDAPPVIEVADLRLSFLSGHGFSRNRRTVKAVDGVTFSVTRGTTFGIVGESGSGKSSIARLLCRLERADSGRISVEGHDVPALKGSESLAFRRAMQMVFQDPYASLDPNWKVGTLVAEGMRVHDIVPRRQRRDRAAELLERCGLAGDIVDRFPHEFSGGQRQRICIARALAVEPRILILDEPVSALDVSIQAQILLLLQQLQRDMGLTYVFISHDLAVVEQMCDRVAVMKAGQFVEVGPIADVIQRPQHPYTQALIAATPVPDPRKRRRSSPRGRNSS